MRVEVTQGDIDRGAKHDYLACPIALAICHATGSREGSVHVGRFLAVFRTPEKAADVPLPTAAREFIERFDAGEPVAPFAFDWPGYDRMIAREGAQCESR